MEASGISFWELVLRWIVENQIGDVASVVGLLVAIVGFSITVYNVFKSRKAAQRAEVAAKHARDAVRSLDAVVDFSAAISLLEEIKRHHRQQQWVLLPDRYAAIRKLLISLNSSTNDLSDSHRVSVQGALANLTAMEMAVERQLGNPAGLNSAKFNKILSRDIDNLQAALTELKYAKTGG